MKSISRGKDISGVEVTNISKHGLWLLTGDEELFVPFTEFPRFQDANVSRIMKVEWPNPDYLSWPDLHLDLALQSIRRFPLVSNKSRPKTRPGR
jgi:hypothetical protein